MVTARSGAKEELFLLLVSSRFSGISPETAKVAVEHSRALTGNHEGNRVHFLLGRLARMEDLGSRERVDLSDEVMFHLDRM